MAVFTRRSRISLKLESVRNDPWTKLNLTVCDEGIFDSEHVQNRWQTIILVAAIVPAVLLILIRACLARRRSCAKESVGGRPGLPIPIHFIGHQPRKGAICCVFGICIIFLYHSLFFPNIFPIQSDNAFLTPPICALISLLVGLIVYAVFICISSDSIIFQTIGTAYATFLAFVIIIHGVPCGINDGWTKTFYIVSNIPLWACTSYVICSLPVYIYTSCTKPPPSLKPPKMDSTNAYLYVNDLFKKNRIQMQQRLRDKAKNKIFKSHLNIPYPITLLIGINTSIVLINYISFSFVHIFYYLRSAAFIIIQTVYELSTNSGVNTIFNMLEGKNEENIAKAETIIDEMGFWFDSFIVVGNCAVFASMVLTSISLLATFPRYRVHMQKLYQGDFNILPNIRYRRQKYPQHTLLCGLRYIGYQMAYAVLGLLVQAIILNMIFQTVYTIVAGVWRYGLPPPSNIPKYLSVSTLILGSIEILQRVFCKYAFLQWSEYKEKPVFAIDNRSCLQNFWYLSIFFNIPIGILSALARAIKSLLINFWLLPRLDSSVMNREHENWDSGYSAYIGLLALEGSITNPVMRGFVEILSDRLCRDKIVDDEQPLTRSPTKCPISARARQRWFLALSLIRNPVLLQGRKYFLRANPLYMPEHDIDDKWKKTIVNGEVVAVTRRATAV